MGLGKIVISTTKILLIIGLILSILFYILVGLGLSSKLQTIWVTTAMTTMNHKWLATSIISKSKIEAIMFANLVDDSGYESDIIDIPKIEASPLNPVSDDILVYPEDEVIELNQYELEGYTTVEKGLYLKEVIGTGWRGNLMLVENPLRIRLTDTPKQYTIGTTVKKMVENTGGIAGINGGGFNDGPNYDSNGGSPAGLIIRDGILISPLEYDEAIYSMIGINSEGALVLKKTTAKWAIENGIVSAVSFNPYIIVNGVGVIKNGTGGWGIAPRTAIGQRGTGEIVFLVIDGRQPTWSVGVDLKVLQDVLLEEECVNAAMLDGGSSTVMVYNGEFVNKPSLGKERYINNAWIVK